ncbi:ATP-binding protein [Candidatus Pacearchaeota archaeon]|nr:ATP-binding protein [Candidatus Pacearchaeota archaeon]
MEKLNNSQAAQAKSRQEPEKILCPICKDQGVLYFGDTEPGQPSKVQQCECSKNNILNQIPTRFQNATFLEYRKTKAELISPKTKKITLPDFIEKDFEGSYLICGDFNKGKTHLLYAQYQKISQEQPEKQLIVYRESDLLKELQQAAYGEGVEQLNSLLLHTHAKDKIPTHIFIDDLGKTPVTEDRLYQLYNFLDIIYNCEHGLTITTNFKISEIEKRWGSNHSGSIISRLKTICQWIYLFD